MPGVGDPETIISWNVNGLPPQLKNAWSEFRSFLEKERPDVLCLQEVRMAAAGPRGCKRGDGQRRRRGEPKCDTPQERSDWQLVQSTFLAAVGSDYSVYWSLADWKYSGTAMLVRKPLKPSRVSYTLPAFAQEGASSLHQDPANKTWHPEGRIICASFQSFDLLATYAPNNGNDEAAFARRAAWDSALSAEVKGRQRPLVWVGDINCAPEPADVSHPEWFLQQCYQGEVEDMCGQPGFTPGERKRYLSILDAGRLVDSYRRLHPASEPPPAGGPYYTWRGHPPVHQPVAKYHGKGMRIDHCLISEELLPRLKESSILGHSEGRIGFMGSDHCPIRARLVNAEDKTGCTSVAPPSDSGNGSDRGDVVTVES